MKHHTKLVFFSLLIVLGFSCVDEPEGVSWQVNIHLVESEGVDVKELEGASVTLLNLQKSAKKESKCDAFGKVIFHNVEPGFYAITASHRFNKNARTYSLNGNKEIEVFESLRDTIALRLSSQTVFVIKELYYAGCTTDSGSKYNADQFIEIYNNTAEKQYADGLSIIEHGSYADGENPWQDIKDSVVVKTIFTVPGGGADVPVDAGKGIVIAQNGINHRSDALGNPNSPVDLGNADFEFFLLDDKLNDIDAAGVANLEEDFMAFRGNDFVMFTRGGSAMALAKLPGLNQEERKTQLDKWSIRKVSVSGSTSSSFVKIPNALILDAVEVIRSEDYAAYKRFPVELDAGYTYLSSGSGSGLSIRRKIDSISAGRIIYLDTDNSTIDFLTDVEPKPGVYEE